MGLSWERRSVRANKQCRGDPKLATLRKCTFGMPLNTTYHFYKELSFYISLNAFLNKEILEHATWKVKKSFSKGKQI